MNRDYAVKYRHLYLHHWWWRAREQAVVRVLREQLGHSRDERILDIGCGDGLLFDQLAKFGHVQGVEVCGELISRDNPWRDRIHVGPFDESFAPRGEFSVILMLDVLEHMSDPCGALRHVHRLLAPDGFVLIHVPAFMSLWTSHDELNQHFTRYTQRSLRQVLETASLRAQRMQYTFYWTCPVKLAIRFKEWLFRTVPQPPAVPPRLVNAVCYQLCRLEQRLFGQRSPGFGTSILAVVKHGVRCEPIVLPRCETARTLQNSEVAG